MENLICKNFHLVRLLVPAAFVACQILFAEALNGQGAGKNPANPRGQTASTRACLRIQGINLLHLITSNSQRAHEKH